MGRIGWGVIVGGATAVAVGLVAAIVGAQLGYAGVAAPLRALAEPGIRHAVGLSLATATAASALALLVAVPTAYGLARWRFPGAGAVDVLLDLPVVLSPVALGVSLLLLLRSGWGQWVEEHLIRFVFEVPGIVLAQFIVSLALAIRVLKAAFQQIDVRYEQVARFLGCTPWGAFRRVTLPLARKGVVAAYALAWARAVGEFGATVTLAGAVAGKTETIPVAIYLRMATVDVAGAVALMLLLSGISVGVLVAVRCLGAGGSR
ncbi:MAG: ABC transporter permease subunit [Deferrisomatales bacterium]